MGEKKLKQQISVVVPGLISKLSPKEKELLLVWSEKALTIRENEALSKSEKIKALSKLENDEVGKVIFLKIFEILKNKIWNNQSWSRRLGFLGLATGMSYGGAAVGIATMGAGIGVPLILMTAAGGVILGAAIDEIKKEI